MMIVGDLDMCWWTTDQPRSQSSEVLISLCSGHTAAKHQDQHCKESLQLFLPEVVTRTTFKGVRSMTMITCSRRLPQ
jgi:hypothetical protein